MNSTGIWDKTRALFLAALMITSVFAGTITLTGAAVAASAGNTATADPGKFQVSVIGADGNADQTFAIDPDTGVITRAGPSSDNKTVGNVNSAEDSSAVIAFAIGNASSDQTVLVGSGTYNGSISIQTSGISLETDDGATIVGDGVNTGSQPHAAIHVDDSSGPVENVTISGFTVENPDGNFGIFAGTGSTNGQNDGISGLVLEDNTIEDISTTVDDSALTGGPAGIGIRGDYGTDGKPGIVIQNNVIDNVENVAGAEPTGITLKSFTGDAGFGFNSSGAAVEDTASPPATNTDILNNEISNISSSDGGFATKGISVSGEFEDVLIAENTLSQITSPGRVNVITLTENSGSFSGNQYDIDGDGEGERIGPRDFEITNNNVNQISAGDGRGINIGGYEDLSGTDGHIIADNNIQNASVTRFAGTQDGFSIGSADALNVQDNDVTPAPGSPALALGNATSVSGNDLNSDSLDVRVSRNVSDVNGQIVQLYEQNTLVNVSIGNDAARENRTDEPGSPGIQSVEIEDTDTDGDIENVTITATENLTDSEFDTSDFEINEQNPSSVTTGADAYDEVVVLNFSNSDLDGTGPEVITEASTASADLTDLAGNTSTDVGFTSTKIIDSASPVLEDIEATPRDINKDNSPTTVDVSFTFSENVSLNNDGAANTFPAAVRQNDDGVVGITLTSVDGDTVSGTTDQQLANSFGIDYFAGFDVPSGTVVDNSTQSNTNIALNTSTSDQFDNQQLDVDLVAPELSDSTITTLDTDNDGQVDQLEVEFNDDLNDQTVDPTDFSVTDPSATVDSVDTGATVNDNIVFLNVSGLPEDNTSVTPVVTVDANSIEDTAGNTGPAVSGGETQESVDGASPIVTSLTVNGSDSVTFNSSEIPSTVLINATFSENLSTDPTVTIVGLNGDISATGLDASDGEISVESEEIAVDVDSTDAFVNVSDGSDTASNELVTFNQSRITVDTQSPTVTVDADIFGDDLQSNDVDINENVSVSDGGEIDTVELAVDDNDGKGLEEIASFDSVSELNDRLSNFDTTQFDDGALTIQVNATDAAGNENTDSGTLDVDNTAPALTINEPAETTAAPGNGTVTVNVTVDEPNIAGDATVVLEGENNTIVYDVPVSDGDNTFDLKLNTSANATAPGSDVFLPNQTATNGSFETKVVYDLSVTVDDETDRSTTATQADSLFLDNTPPENFSLLAPDEPAEYGENGRNSLVVAYGYTEDNTDSVTVELIDEADNVDATVQVDESQYTDDGVIKSFKLEDEIDFTALADDRYNVSVTVTDVAGNELVENTTNAPVFVNNEEDPNGEVTFNSADATADLNATTEQVTVNVTYNVSVENLNDVGDLPEDQVEAQLNDVNITADGNLVTATLEYYDESAGEYETITAQNVSLSEFEGIEVVDVDNKTVTATANTSVNITDVFGDVLAEDDRVLDYTVEVNSGADITVEADGNVDDDTTSVSVNDDSATLVDQDPVEPRIESVEVGGTDTLQEDPDTLEITFTRPVVEVGDEDLTPGDFGYQDISGDGSNFIDSVSDVDGDTTIEVTLSESVTAEDVGADIVSLQDGGVLETDTSNVAASPVAVSPDNGTVQETTEPTITDTETEVKDDATQVTLTFDAEIQAGDGGDLTAANFSYEDNSPGGLTGIANVTQTGDNTIVVTLNGSATQGDIDDDRLVLPDDEAFDRFGNAAPGQSITLTEEVSAGELEVVAPSDRIIRGSTDTVQVSYRYTATNVSQPDEVQVQLIDTDGNVDARINIEDDQYVDDGRLKTIAVNLRQVDELDDDEYTLRVRSTDQSGDISLDDANGTVVINDDAPAVSDVSVDPASDVAPDETIDVSYDYVNPGVNATSVTVTIAQAGDTVATVPQSIDSGSAEQTVQVDLSGLGIDDNEDYTVSVTVTDESGLTGTAESQADALDVNAEQPTIESVETNAGSDTVTVTFSEPVVAADGEVSLDDFAYQDVSDSGASAIESVAYDGDSQREIVLTLDSEVTAEDLGSDLVNVREGALEDTDGDTARQVPLNATALADTTDPTVDVTAPDISLSNDDSVPVSVNVGGEETSEVAVTLTGPDGTELSGSGLSPTLDATTLEDGTVTVSVTVTDAGGNTETGQTTVEKDTVRPTIESATTDVNSDQVTVTFSEPVTGVQVSDFDITSPAHRVESVSDTDDDATVTLVLNASVPAAAINNSELAVVSSTATDSLGNAADDESVLTDTGVPVIDSAEVGTNSSTITVDFDEPVEAGDGGALTADNFSYTGAGEIINVSHDAGASTATLVLSEPVTDAELGSAEVTAEDGAVVDLFDNSAVLSETVVDETAPSGVELVEPSGEVLKQSSDLLNVTYRYVENVPSNVDSVDITLTPTDGGESVTYQIDDTEYPDTAANKTLTLDLDSVVESELADGAYTVSIEVTDGSGNTNSASSEDAQVVINDDAPAVSDVSVDSASDVAPDETINVSYNYSNPGVNATSVTVHIVENDDRNNFTSGDLLNATFAQYVFDETERTPVTQTVTVDLSDTPDVGSQLADNDDYVVFVTATDESGLTNLNTSADPIIEGPVSSDSLDVNAGQPTIESVETNAGSDTVTVTFSEPVVAADDEISLDDFSYTDADGTTRIVNADAGGDSVVLTLSNDVDAESLGEDVVNVREDAIEDTDGINARQVPLNATALADTTAPTAEVSAEDVNAQNADNFQVNVTAEPLSEPSTIIVTATGSDGETVSANASVTDDTTVALNVSALADGEVTISVEATDVAGNSGSQSTASTTVTKDTVAPTIESATTNAGTSTVAVTFSESVTDVAASAFSITSPVHEVDSVSQQDTTVVLRLNQSVPPAAINVSGVQVSATGVSDSVGNDVTNEVNFTDVEAPSIAAVSAERNSSTVTVTFTEVITGGGESQNLTAEDFEYADNSNTSVSGIVSVNKTGPQTAVLTVNGSFTPSDLAEDTVAVAPESVFDTVDNAASSNAVGLGFEASLDASSTNDTVTIRVVTAQNITDAVDSLQVTEQNVEFAELEGFETNDRFETSLNASEFTEVEPGVFETAIELPRDDTYTVSGVVSSTFQTETTTVDTSVPEPTDAVVLEVTSEAQLDDSRETTRLRVLFDEPIDASQISPDDVTVGGLDGEIVAVQDAGAFGAVEVIVEGDLQTGDSPEISIAGSSYTDLNGTQGVENGSTVIHTDVVQLNEGVNLVSVPAASGSLDISELPLDAIESISRYNAETDSFEVFVPGAPNNPFTTLDGGEGYIIRLENGTTASVAINVANEPTGEGGPNSVDLSEGLNLIGHYQEDQQAVTTALSSVTAGQDGQFSDTVFTVLSQDEEAGGFTYESFRAGEFSTMEDGEAYWVFVTEDETYTEAPFDDR